MEENIETMLSLILIGAAFGIYVTENQSYVMTYNMSSDFREKTDAVLTNINPEIIKHISSINVIDAEKVKEICAGNRYGCAYTNVDIFGKITNADIYIANNYNKCYPFEWVLYHEIGHIDDIYQNGNILNYYGNDQQIEYYADNFASQYANNNCIRRT